MKVYIDGVSDTSENNLNGKHTYRVPEYEYRAGIDLYPIDKLRISCDVRGFGEQYIDAYNQFKNKAVTLVDAKVSYDICKNVQLYGLGSNLFNIDYESIFNSSGKLSGGIPNHSYYPKDGRYFEIGTTLKF